LWSGRKRSGLECGQAEVGGGGSLFYWSFRGQVDSRPSRATGLGNKYDQLSSQRQTIRESETRPGELWCLPFCVPHWYPCPLCVPHWYPCPFFTFLRQRKKELGRTRAGSKRKL
jgi:hypothetical protein